MGVKRRKKSKKKRRQSRRMEPAVLVQSHPDADHVAIMDTDLPVVIGGQAYNFHPDVAVPDPPQRFQQVLSFLLKAEERDGALGDLVEKYRGHYREHGRRTADRWLAFQVLRSLFPLIIRLGGKIAWVILGEWIKKHIS